MWAHVARTRATCHFLEAARTRATCRTLEAEALAVSSCLNFMYMPQVLLFVWVHGDSAHDSPRYEHADLNRHDLLPIVL